MSGSRENCAVGSLHSTPLVFAFVVFTGISPFNVLELLITLFITFVHYRSIYFYSLLGSIIGVLIYQTFAFALFFSAGNKYAIIIFCLIGWACMITGHSFVLWSRLHLVMGDERKLRWVRNAIIFNGVSLHICQSIATIIVRSP